MSIVSGVGGLVGGGGGVAGATFGSISINPYSWRLVRMGVRGATTYSKLPGWVRTAIAAGMMPGPISFKFASAPMIAYGYWQGRNYARKLQMPGSPGSGGTGGTSGTAGGTGSALGYAANIARGGRRLEWPVV